MIEVFGQRVEAEAFGNALHAPRLGHRLEAADQQLAGVFLVVGAFVLHAQHRQVARQAVDGLGDDVEMLGSVQGHGHADVGRQLVRPHARAQDHGVRGNVAAIGVDADGATLLDADAFDLRVLEDLRAALPGALGQGLRRVDRIGLAVLRQEDAANHVVDVRAAASVP